MNTASIQILEALQRTRLACGCEAQLQLAVERVLLDEHLPYQREKILSDRDRIDFWLVRDCVGIECKVSGSVMGVTSQLLRYAEHKRIAALILVTNRWRLIQVPRQLGGKRVDVHVERSL